jgi:hypothetical protein
MPLINITRDDGATMVAVDDASLARTVGFLDKPTEFVVFVEWREDDRLVRRDAHVLLKTPSVTADALVGGIG